LPPDAADALVGRARTVALGATDDELSRAANCVAVGIVEMIASAREPRLERIARALAAADPSTDAVATNAFLMHAQLADDSYRLAEHPGLAVLPVALAAAQRDPGADGRRWLGAVAAGYEAACALADLLLPGASQRGFRVTAAVAPVAAAVTAALLTGTAPDLRDPHDPQDPHEDHGPDAVRIAAATAGGPLGVFAGGDAWRLQPALAAAQGVLAERAARAGARGAPGALEGEQGILATLAGATYTGIPAGPPRIGQVMFKRHPVPMYGQAVFDAIRRAGSRLEGATALTVRVAPFAAAYGDQRPGAVTSVAAITRAALAQTGAASAATMEIEVVGDAGLGLHDAVVELAAAGGGSAARLTGSGDTSGWSPDDVAGHCAARIGPTGSGVAAAAHEMVAGGSSAALLQAWRAARSSTSDSV